MSSPMPPFERRPLGFDLYSYRDCYDYHEKVLMARDLATKTPLKSGLQFALDLEIPQQNPDPKSRVVPRVGNAQSVGK